MPVFKCQKTPPKIVGQTRGSYIRASIKPILKSPIFSIVLEAFYPVKRPKLKNDPYFLVYRSKILKKKVGGSPHLCVPLVKRHKQNLKKLFLGIPFCRYFVDISTLI